MADCQQATLIGKLTIKEIMRTIVCDDTDSIWEQLNDDQIQSDSKDEFDESDEPNQIPSTNLGCGDGGWKSVLK